jgi:WASH complex subunit 7
MVSAFSSSECLLYRSGAADDLHRALEDELLQDLEECIIRPLCHDIETDLRLHIHSARLTGVVEVNPFRRDLSKFLSVVPLRLATVEVRGIVLD